MKKTYYELIGSQYVPVLEYDSDYLDSFPQGTHLVICNPSGRSRKLNVDPDYAGLIAASQIAQDAMCSAMLKASELKPKSVPLTPGQRRAWRALAKEFGDELSTLQGSSVYDIAQAGIQALYAQANKNMSHPSVKAAFDEFIVISKLCAKPEDV